MTNRYKPIEAPITPEKQAALALMSQRLAAAKPGDIIPAPKELNILEANKIVQLRDKFESWILESFYCPKGLRQLQKDSNGKYSQVAYNKKDSTKFSEIEQLWQAYLTGHCHLR